MFIISLFFRQLEKIVSELRSHINDQNVQNKEKKERYAKQELLLN